MRIVIVNQYVGPERWCPAFRPTHLARQWVRAGHDVTIVGASFSHLFHETPVVRDAVTRVDEDGVRYLLLKTPRYAGNGVGRALSMFAFVARLYALGRWVRRTLAPDVVIAGSVHGLDVLPCRAWARASGARLVRDVRDLWPLTLTELNGLGRAHPIVLLLSAAECHGYRVVDRVTTTLGASLEYMRERGLSEEKWRFVPHGVDVERWDAYDAPLPDAHAAALRRFRDEGRLTVGYTGSHGHTNALDVLLDAAALLAGEPVGFVLVGQGPEKAALERRAAVLNLRQVVFLPSVPRAAVKRLLEAVDVAYIGWRRSPLYDYSISPNKLMDYMLAGRPVVHSVAAANDLVTESGCGRSVPPEDPALVAEAIRWMHRVGPDERARLGGLGRAFVVRRLPYPAIARQYLDAVR